MEILNFLLKHIPDLIAIIIGLLTLKVALKVHKEFIKNHATSKQVEEIVHWLKV